MIDWAVAAAFVLAAEIELGLAFRFGSPGWGITALTHLSLIAMVWWRRRPLAALVVLAAVGVIGATAGAQSSGIVPFGVLLLSYSLGANARNRDLIAGMVVSLTGLVVIDLLRDRSSLPGAAVYFLIFLIGGPMLIGRLIRSRSRQAADLRRMTATLEAERETAEANASAAERIEVALQMDREVLRGIEEIATMARDATGASDAGAIETNGRELLARMRRIVVLLSPVDAPNLTTEIEPVQAGWTNDVDAINQLPWPPFVAFAYLCAFFAEAVHAMPSSPWYVFAAGGLLMAAPLLWCRSRPLLAASLTWSAAAMLSLVVPNLRELTPQGHSQLISPVTIYLLLPFCVAAFGNWRRASIGLAICLLGATAYGGVEGLIRNAAVPMLAFWAAGLIVHDRLRFVQEIRVTNARLAADRDLRAHAAAIAERVRIARELHDVAGHSLTVIVLQAGAARRLWHQDRETAERALATATEVANSALSDLERSLGALDVAPRGGLEDIEAVVETARLAGLDVELRISGPMPEPGQPGLELVAYRIVQEALTNVMKHAPGAGAEVKVECDGAELRLEIENRITVAGALPVAGHGLRGMKDRVQSIGGSLEWRSCDGQFKVLARLHFAPTRAI
jgi:signal transduction histidine kinase